MNDALPIVGTAYYYTKEILASASKFGIKIHNVENWEDLTNNELN